jgi:hypothetical protein
MPRSWPRKLCVPLICAMSLLWMRQSQRRRLIPDIFDPTQPDKAPSPRNNAAFTRAPSRVWGGGVAQTQGDFQQEQQQGAQPANDANLAEGTVAENEQQDYWQQSNTDFQQEQQQGDDVNMAEGTVAESGQQDYWQQSNADPPVDLFTYEIEDDHAEDQQLDAQHDQQLEITMQQNEPQYYTEGEMDQSQRWIFNLTLSHEDDDWRGGCNFYDADAYDPDVNPFIPTQTDPTSTVEPPLDETGRAELVCDRDGVLFFPYREFPVCRTVTGAASLHVLQVDPQPFMPNETVRYVNQSVLLTRFTCEGNLHHMMAETLFPLADILFKRLGNVNNVSKPVVYITPVQRDDYMYLADLQSLSNGDVRRTGFFKIPCGKCRCKSDRFAEYFDALPISPVLRVHAYHSNFNFPAKHHRLHGDPDPLHDNITNTTTCYKNLHIALPLKGKEEYLESALPRWLGCANTSTGSARTQCVLVLRTAANARVILNEDAVVATLLANGCDTVQRAHLETMPPKKQAGVFLCGPPKVVIGVHGAGLQYAQWMKKKAGTVQGILEWGFGQWGTPPHYPDGGFYRNDHLPYVYRNNTKYVPHFARQTNAQGCYMVEDPKCNYPHKFHDVEIDLASIVQDIQNITWQALKVQEPVSNISKSSVKSRALH